MVLLSSHSLRLPLWPRIGLIIATTMNAHAAVPTTPSSTTGDVSSSDRALYIKNEHDSGYNPKNNFDNFGNVLAVPYGQ